MLVYHNPVIEGTCFVDKESQIPVPFVEINTKKGTVFSNIKGVAYLDSLSTIDISHPIYLPIAKIISSSDTTELTPIDIQEKVCLYQHTIIRIN